MRVVIILILIVLAFTAPADLTAKVFYAKDEAIRAAFPEADVIENQVFFLTDDQKNQVEALARTPLDSKLVTIYIGKRGQKLLGYAMIDAHTVRTLPEAVMVALTPDGRVSSTLVLAFYEPLDYLPNERWLKQFDQARLAPDLRVGGRIAGITGATLTARAMTTSVRKVLAFYQVLIAKGRG
ncbi:FMN-binding protein [Candidatus Methylomirabilis sp.]|uniref:FMN-binding protein n=1 Tax=Candidatus Methylomirabilis sp. TaxID=2032687 RepID=UPI0030766B7A